MFQSALRVLTLMIMALIVALGATALLKLLLTLPIPWSNGELIAGVVGTATAVGIPFYELRRRQRAKLLTARLRAAEMAFDLHRAQQTMNQVCTHLQLFIQGDPDPLDFSSLRDLLSGIDMWNTDDINTLVPMGETFAAGLAASSGQIKHAIKNFERAMLDPSLTNSEPGVTFAEGQLQLLDNAIRAVGKCISECIEARNALGLK